MNKKHKLLHKDNEYITSKLEIIYEEDIQRIVEERNNLQSKIDKAIEFINSKHNWYGDEEEDNEDYLFELEDFEQLLDILEEDK